MPASPENDIARIVRTFEIESRKLILQMVRAHATVPDIERALGELRIKLDPTQRLRETLEGQIGRSIREATEELKESFVEGRTPVSREPLAEIAGNVLRGFTRAQAEQDARVLTEVSQAIRLGLPLRAIENRIGAVLGSTRHVAETLALTGVRGIGTRAHIDSATAAGIEEFTYAGPEAERPFCEALMRQARTGKAWTLVQIRAMTNGQKLPVETYCGGYRCKHRWRAVVRKRVPPTIVDMGAGKKDVKAKQPAPTPPLPLRTTTPAGHPPAKVVDIKPGRHAKAAREAVRLIGTVHGTLELPKVPVVELDSLQFQGRYHPSWGGPSKAQKIEVRFNSKEQEATTVHEFGHLIDDMALGKKGSFASGRDPDLKEWRDAVNASRAVEELRRIHKAGGSYMRTDASGTQRRVSEATEYLLQPAELWARSYAQYIATKTGDETLLRQISGIRETRPTPFWQWEPDDFQPILEAIDNLFLKKGWLK